MKKNDRLSAEFFRLKVVHLDLRGIVACGMSERQMDQVIAPTKERLRLAINALTNLLELMRHLKCKSQTELGDVIADLSLVLADVDAAHAAGNTDQKDQYIILSSDGLKHALERLERLQNTDWSQPGDGEMQFAGLG